MNTLSPETLQESTQNLTSINPENIQSILRGASLLSSGGGGEFSTALQTYRNMNLGPVEVRDLDSFDQNDTIVTIFGLGPVDNDVENALDIARRSLTQFEYEVEQIDGIILGEIGPGLIVESAMAASELDIPVVNADVAGMRAVPSIHNEIIEGSHLNRTPLVAVDSQNEVIIEETLSGEELENRLRGLSSGDLWYITGYAHTASELQETVATGWLQECLNFEQTEVDFMGAGTLVDKDLREIDGHTVGRLVIEGENIFEVFLRNENLLLLQDGETVAEAPNMISLVSPEGYGVYNGNIPEIGTEIEIHRMWHPVWDDNEHILNPEIEGFTVEENRVIYNESEYFDIRGGSQ